MHTTQRGLSTGQGRKAHLGQQGASHLSKHVSIKQSGQAASLEEDACAPTISLESSLFFFSKEGRKF